MNFEEYAKMWTALLQSDNLDLQANFIGQAGDDMGVWVVYRGATMAFASAKEAIG